VSGIQESFSSSIHNSFQTEIKGFNEEKVGCSKMGRLCGSNPEEAATVTAYFDVVFSIMHQHNA
jgi:hypothetical protein